MASLSNLKPAFTATYQLLHPHPKCSKTIPHKWRVSVRASSSAAPGVDLNTLESAIAKAAIGGFSSFFPDYQERITSHEAAHFLVAYLLGIPILGYSLDIGKENVNLIDERLEKLIYSGQLDAKELDRLAVVAMAGLAAEGLKYDKVIGQSADLFTLQRFINRSKPQLSKEQQQNLTRWAVIHEALMTAMSKKATVLECIEAIEKAA
uniref:Peptidase M41 domain-containing protein n=1 Tax=Fagus sylvatica TaxID=28930 RepID=A0A2N9EKX2_FAGSY